jgi:hypothetical protein
LRQRNKYVIGGVKFRERERERERQREREREGQIDRVR